MGGRGSSSGGSGGGVSKTVNSLTRGMTSTTYSLNSVDGSELQVVKRIDGYRSVATFSIPESETGKGYGKKLMLAALKDGPILYKGADDIGNNFTTAAYRVRQSLIKSGKAHVITDEYGTQLLVKGKK